MIVPINASTVVPLRYSQGSLEVFLLQKAKALEFAGGAYVFPGGTLHTEDTQAEWHSHFSTSLQEQIRREFTEVSLDEGVSFYVTALRELFEEAGILLTDSSISADVLKECRHEVLKHKNFLEQIQKYKLQLAFEKLTYFAHWITPEIYPMRFTTRFFMTEITANETLSADGYETIHGIWISPSLAITRESQGTLPLMPPTLVTLQELSRFKSAREAIDWGKKRTKIARQPRVDSDGTLHV